MIDGGQNLRQGYQMPPGQHVPQRRAVHIFESGRCHPEIARGPGLQVWVGPVTPSPICGLILLVQGDFEFFQDWIWIGEFRQASAREKFSPCLSG